MSDRLSWLPHGETRVLVVDYSTLQSDEIIALAAEVAPVYESLPAHGARILVVTTGAKADAPALDALKAAVLRLRGKEVRAACIGVTGLQRLLLNALNLFTSVRFVPFDTRDEALAWLARPDAPV